MTNSYKLTPLDFFINDRIHGKKLVSGFAIECDMRIRLTAHQDEFSGVWTISEWWTGFCVTRCRCADLIEAVKAGIAFASETVKSGKWDMAIEKIPSIYDRSIVA